MDYFSFLDILKSKLSKLELSSPSVTDCLKIVLFSCLKDSVSIKHFIKKDGSLLLWSHSSLYLLGEIELQRIWTQLLSTLQHTAFPFSQMFLLHVL